MRRNRLVTWILATALELVAAPFMSNPVRAENGWTFAGSESPVDPSTRPCCNLVARGPEGQVYYVFGTSEAGSGDIYFMKSRDFGETWTTPVKIDTDPPGMNFSTPYDLVANTSGDVYLFFLDNRGPDGRFQSVRANFSHDAGETWLSEDVLVSGCCGASGFADASLGPAGTIYVTSGRDLFVSNDFGTSWQLLRQYQHLITVCPDDRGNI
jgi:hypothetical protein